jgi:chromosome segregation ATPase
MDFPSNNTLSKDERLRITQCDQLEKENTLLVDQLKELTRMNSHWQRYDAQREEYVLKLTKTNQELQDKLENVSETSGDAKTTSSTSLPPIPLPMSKTKTAPDTDHKDKDKDRNETKVTPMVMEEMTKRINELEQRDKDNISQIKSLKEQIKTVRESPEEMQETIDMLREQISVCVVDFKAERADRERLNEEKLKLEEACAHGVDVAGTGNARTSSHAPARHMERQNVYQQQWQYQHSNAPRYPRYYGEDLTRLPSDVEIDGDHDYESDGEVY